MAGNVHITSDGTPQGTLVTADGVEIKGVYAIEFDKFGVRDVLSVKLHIYPSKIDLVAEEREEQ